MDIGTCFALKISKQVTSSWKGKETLPSRLEGFAEARDKNCGRDKPAAAVDDYALLTQRTRFIRALLIRD